MIDPKWFSEVSEKMANAMPPAFKQFKDEWEKNLKAVLQASFAKLDLVTREEFDLQVKLLQKCRDQLAELEKRLKAFEQK